MIFDFYENSLILYELSLAFNKYLWFGSFGNSGFELVILTSSKSEEFVAHASNVNCLKIGRKTSTVFVTGGEDHQVNLWAIGKPDAIVILSGHTSAVESVNFDSSEVLVAAGAANGTIKLWDLEDTKVLCTLSGHRSSCISVDFHPFRELIASGSLDTNLKLWDIRSKGCIHTYKGHTQGVNAIRFSPDGRWLVSGGDNIVKLWDLTAGKLLHDFKCHEGQIQCIDFHPYEFLLATGSADKTVKFWDLETLEMIGSSGPEACGVRSMTFNPDGRTLFCGLHESLKVLSWEPIRCHDVVDVGWSRLSDLNVHEGKLVGCSYDQCYVGVWVVNILSMEPFVKTSASRSTGYLGSKSKTSSNQPLTDSNSKTGMETLSISQNSVNSVKTSMGRLSISQNSETVAKETKPLISPGSVPSTSQRTGLSSGLKKTASNSATALGAMVLKTSSSKFNITTNIQNVNESVVVPVIVARTSSRADMADDFGREMDDVVPVTIPKASSIVDLAADLRQEASDAVPVVITKTSSRLDYDADFRSETGTGRTQISAIQSKVSDLQKFSNNSVDSERANIRFEYGSMGNISPEQNENADSNLVPAVNVFDQTSAGKRILEDVQMNSVGEVRENLSMEPNPTYSFPNYDARVIKTREENSMDVLKGGRTESLVVTWGRREQSSSYEELTASKSSENMSAASINFTSRECLSSAGQEMLYAGDEDAIADLMEQHEQFLTSAQSQLMKLQLAGSSPALGQERCQSCC